jgi:hypothetical protein
VCLYLIFQALGTSFFACFAVFIIGGVATSWIADRIMLYRKVHLGKQDKRLNITAECLNNIKMLKLYSWIDVFLAKIDERRGEELAVRKTLLWYDVLMSMVSSFTVAGLQSTAFTVYIGTGHTLELQVAFQLIAVF